MGRCPFSPNNQYFLASAIYYTARNYFLTLGRFERPTPSLGAESNIFSTFFKFFHILILYNELFNHFFNKFSQVFTSFLKIYGTFYGTCEGLRVWQGLLSHPEALRDSGGWNPSAGHPVKSGAVELGP